MDKEEILKKSRAESRDEGEEHAISVGAKWSVVGMACLYLFLVMITTVLEGFNSVTLMPLHGMCWLGLGLMGLGKASVNQDKRLRLTGIVQTIMGATYVIAYVVVLVLKYEPRW